MQSLVSKLSVKLIFNQLKLISVESCTGGWIGKIITDTPGNSSWYEGGFITYSNQSKQLMVNVSEQTLDKFGAVSQEVAAEMVEGACRLFPDSVAVSVTGIAGPDGGSPNKPVGTVCIAVKFKDRIKVRKFSFIGKRDAIRKQTVRESFNMLLTLDYKK